MKQVKLTSPGIIAVGEYKAGEVYEVDDAKAELLVKVKGFEYVSDKTAKAAVVTPNTTGV